MSSLFGFSIPLSETKKCGVDIFLLCTPELLHPFVNVCQALFLWYKIHVNLFRPHCGKQAG